MHFWVAVTSYAEIAKLRCREGGHRHNVDDDDDVEEKCKNEHMRNRNKCCPKLGAGKRIGDANEMNSEEGFKD